MIITISKVFTCICDQGSVWCMKKIHKCTILVNDYRKKSPTHIRMYFSYYEHVTIYIFSEELQLDP